MNTEGSEISKLWIFVIIIASMVYANDYIINGHGYFVMVHQEDLSTTLCEVGKWCKKIILPYEVKWHIIQKNCDYQPKCMKYRSLEQLRGRGE